ncbi:MAG TPA: class I SAM-dependent methyltransferase [Solirubrobacteraceae bacterium]|nr:class I SAM-dependent methyltransferase [Solirubrobacteraceae bacterium]
MGLDLDAYRRQSRDTWDEMAPGWVDRREWLLRETAPVSDWLVDNCDAQQGQTVVELACGTGDLGLRVAERVGSSGRVISTDFAPEMVDAARRNAQASGAANTEQRVLDAERMDFDDDSADCVICRFGYMLMADPGQALKESRRVLRDGAPLCFAVWRTPDRNPWAAVPALTLVQRGQMQPPEPGSPGIFALGDRDLTVELVRAAGFGEPTLESIDFTFHYADFEDVWDSIMRLAGPLARAIKDAPDADRAATRSAIEDNFASFRAEDGSYSAPASVWGVLAR